MVITFYSSPDFIRSHTPLKNEKPINSLMFCQRLDVIREAKEGNETLTTTKRSGD